MMRKLNTKGFSVIEVILIVVIVGVIGAVGWYVVKSRNNVNKSLDNANNAQSNTFTTPKKKTTPTTQKPVDTAKYLVIKEWKGKIQLSESDSGVYYKMTTDSSKNPDGAFINAEVFATQADALTGPAGINCKGEYIAYLLRLPTNSNAWNSTDNVALFTKPIRIDSYSYAVATKKEYGPSCFQITKSTTNYQADDATANKFQAISDQFVKDFQTISKQ